MVEIDITLKINAPFEKVWNIISNIDNDPFYWKYIVSIKNITRDRNVVLREVYMSNGNKCQQKITFFPKEGIHIRWTRGAITGVKDIMLIDNGSTTIIRAQINYKIGGAVKIGSISVLDELRSETENALNLIKKDAECKTYHLIKRQPNNITKENYFPRDTS